MAKLIDVPEFGNVEFPDSMSDQDIEFAIKNQQPQRTTLGSGIRAMTGAFGATLPRSYWSFQRSREEPKVANMEQLSQDMFNMPADQWIAQSPGHWLSKDLIAARERAATARREEELWKGALQQVTPADQGAVGEILQGAAGNLPLMLGSGGLSLVPRVGMAAASLLAGGGGMAAEYGGGYSEARERGATLEEAQNIGAFNAAVEGPLNALPFMQMATKYGASAARKALDFAITAGGTNALQESLQSASMIVIDDPLRPVTLGEVLDAGWKGGATGLLLGAVGGGIAARPGQPATPEMNQVKDGLVEGYRELNSARQLAAMGQPVDLVAADQRWKQRIEELNKQIATSVETKTAVVEELPDDIAVKAASAARDMQEKIAGLPDNPNTLAQVQLPNEEAAKLRDEILAVSTAKEIADVGRTPKAQETLARRANINDGTAIEDLPVAISADSSELNTPLRKLELKPGTYSLGLPDAFRPGIVQSAQHDTVEEMRQRFLPNTTLLLLNQTSPRFADTSATTQLSANVHAIWAREAKDFDMRDATRFNPQTQMEMYSSLTHEVGHVILKEALRQVATPVQMEQLRAEWQGMRKGIDDGTANTGWLLDNWMGPWKSSRGLLSTQKIPSLAALEEEKRRGVLAAKDRYRWLEPDGIAKGAPGISKDAPAKQFIQYFYDNVVEPGADHSDPDYNHRLARFYEQYLGFDEWVAEQTARYEFSKEHYKDTGLGKLFQTALEKLRNFFRWAKAEGRIAPNAVFAEWLDGLTQTGGLQDAKRVREQSVPDTVRPPKEIKIASEEEVVKAQVKHDEIDRRLAAIEVPPDQVIQPDSPEYLEKKKDLIKTLLSLRLPKGSPAAAAIRQEIVAGRFETAQRMINDLANGNTVDYDLSGKDDYIAEKEYFIGEMSEMKVLQSLHGANVPLRVTTPSGTQRVLKPVVAKHYAMRDVWQSRIFELLGLETVHPIAWFDRQKMFQGLTSLWRDNLSSTYDIVQHPYEAPRLFVGAVLTGNIDLLGPPQTAGKRGAQLNTMLDITTGRLIVVDTGYGLGVSPFYSKMEYPAKIKESLQDVLATTEHYSSRELGRFVQQYRTIVREYIRWEMPVDFVDQAGELADYYQIEDKYETLAKLSRRMQQLRRYFGLSPNPNDASLAGLPATKVAEQRSLAEAEWKKKGTKSAYFLDWAGNWPKAEAARYPIETARRGDTILAPRTSTHVANPETLEPIRVYGLHPSVMAIEPTFGPLMNVAGKPGLVARIAFSNRQAAEVFNRGAGLASSDITGEFTKLEAKRQQFETFALRAEKRAEDLLNLPRSLTRTEAAEVDRLLEDAIDNAQLAGQVLQEQEALVTTSTQTPATPQFFNLRHPLYVDAEGLDLGGWSQLIPADVGTGLHDGLIYKNARYRGAETTVYIAFQDHQVKNDTPESWRTFSQSGDLNFDLSSPEEANAAKLSKKMSRIFKDNRLSATLKHALDAAKYQLLQLQQLAHLHPESPGLQEVNWFLAQYTLNKQRLMGRGERLLEVLQNLPAERYGRVEAALDAEFRKGVHWTVMRQFRDKQGQQRHVHEFEPKGATFTQLKQFGIDVQTPSGQEEANAYLTAKNALLYQLEEAERIIAVRLYHRHQTSIGGASATFGQEVAKLVKKVDEIRNRPFIPQQRFGKYLWEITDVQAGKTVVVHREAFESKVEWEQRQAALAERVAQRRLAGQAGLKLRPIEVPDRQAVLMMLPADFAELAVKDLGLSKVDAQQLIALMQPVKQDKLFKSYEKEYLAISGASPDTLRALASFFWHNSNALAKLQSRGDLNNALRNIRQEVNALQGSGNLREYTSRRELLDYSEKTVDYALNPTAEYYTARALVSVVFLWGNLKTALLNLYGMVTTLSAITSTHGLLRGSGMFLKANADVWKKMFKRTLSPEEEQWFQKAQDEGVLEQSYSFYLAQQATAGAMARRFTSKPLGRHFVRAKRATVAFGMWPFKMTELWSRRATWLVNYRSSRQRGLPPQQAYNEAVKATNLQQNDYTLGARPEFLRGKKSILFVFMSFTQHMAFHAFGGYQTGVSRRAELEGRTPQSWWFGHTMKIWAVTLILAGLEGLPGAENILDILDIIWRKLFGRPIRLQIREYYRDVVGRDPSEVMYGLMHNIGGFDVSRSIGLGRIVPGTDAVRMTGNMYEDIGSLTMALAGPAGGLVRYGLGALYNHGKPWSSLERYTSGAPGGVGNLLRATQWSMHGVRGPNGALLTWDREQQAMRDLTGLELAGAAAGFQPSIVTTEREKRYEIKEEIAFWRYQRKTLLDQYWYSKLHKDHELEKDVLAQIKEYNSSVPHPKMRITAEQRRLSLEAHRDAIKAEETNKPRQKRYRDLAREVGEAY